MTENRKSAKLIGKDVTFFHLYENGGIPMKTRKLLISILTGLCVCLTSATLLTACKDEHTHSYTQQTTTEATCTTKGLITYTCSCNDTYTEEIPALGHDEVQHQAQAATCTEKGWNAYETCSRCD